MVLSEQIIPGSFAFALNYLVDHELDLKPLDTKFKNDETGASAYDPRVMLKIVLLAYSQGLISSRAIEQTCRRNVQFIAKFVASLMRQAIDSPCGRQLYSQCIGMVEPVFGNIRHNKRLSRLDYRGYAKVNAQWNLYCMVHNIEKLSKTELGRNIQ